MLDEVAGSTAVEIARYDASGQAIDSSFLLAYNTVE